MKIFICLIAMLTVIFASGACPSVYADDGSLGRIPEGVYPMQDDDVEMESEEIVVDLGNGKAECTFLFHNTGSEKEVLMGFPGKLDKDWGGELTDEIRLSLSNFTAYADGNELVVLSDAGVLPNRFANEGADFHDFFIII